MSMEDERKDESTNNSTFRFGEYVSPNPKPIPLGRFKPEPSVTYKIKKTVQYDDKENERKEQSEPLSECLSRGSTESIDLESVESLESGHDKQVGMDKVDCKPANTVSFSNPCTTTKGTKGTKHLPTPAKVKVKKQAKEIEFLQAELRRLQFENEKLKSQSISPQNESVSPKKNQIQSERTLSFNPSVDIVNASTTLKNTTLQDKVSLVRSRRSGTPYKSTGTKASRFAQKALDMEAHAQVPVTGAKAKAKATVQVPVQSKSSGSNQNQHQNGNQHQKRGGKKGKEVKASKVSSRSTYRITPIPTKKSKSTKFKSKLNSICSKAEKENMNLSNLGLDDTAPTPKDLRKFKNGTPTGTGGAGQERNGNSKQSKMMSQSFNFGREILGTESETPSFMTESQSLGSSFLKDDTPEFMNQRLKSQTQGKGASNVATPILTPMRGATPPDSKPFSFDWNKK